MISNQVYKKELIILTADNAAKLSIKGLISRFRHLGIRDIRLHIDMIVHPKRDPGVLRNCYDLLRPYLKTHKYCMVVFDRLGCGREDLSRIELEERVQSDLEKNGWKNRCAVLVIDPELEVWIWSDSPVVDNVLGWEDAVPDLREWLVENKYCMSRFSKPHEPQKAFEDVLRHVKKPKSNSMFMELAMKTRLRNCKDESLVKLRDTLRNWFPLI